MDLEIIDVFLRRWPSLRRKAKNYLDDRRATLLGSPDRRDHWMEGDKQVPAAQQQSERIRRMIRNRLQHLLHKAKEGREISMSVAAGALGINEDRVRKLWPDAFGQSRRAESNMSGKARTARSVLTIAQTRKLAEAMSKSKSASTAKSLSAVLPPATAVASPRRLGPSGSASPGPFLRVTQGTIRFNLDLEGSPEALDDFLKVLHPVLVNAAKTKVLSALGITGLSDATLQKYLLDGAELQYMTLAQSLSMPWEHVEEQERWAELYVALLDARAALAQRQRAQVEDALLRATLAPTEKRAEPRRIKPSKSS